VKPTKPVIGLIGAICAGKSTVARLLAGHGGAVVDADKLGHAVLDEPEVQAQLVTRWGERVRGADGRTDRRVIGPIVFADPAERAALEAIVFPRIRAREAAQFAAADADPACRFIALDAAVLLEAGQREVCDKLLFVDAPLPLRQVRVAARGKWTAAELARREAAQMPLAEKRSHADAVIVNDGDLAALDAAVAQVLQGWRLLGDGETLTTGRTEGRAT
jgi:dephospho-CoA kinase